MDSDTILIHSSDAEGGDQSLPALTSVWQELHWLCLGWRLSVGALRCLDLASIRGFQ